MAKSCAKLEGLQDVERAFEKGIKDILDKAEKGLKKAALHLTARAKAIAPEDTTNLAQGIHSEGVERTATGMRATVACKATGGEKMDGTDEGDYAKKVHENMEYDGPNVGGSRTQQRGPRTTDKGVSAIESSDGTAGGKYLERPLRNKTKQYVEIIKDEIAEVLE